MVNPSPSAKPSAANRFDVEPTEKRTMADPNLPTDDAIAEPEVGTLVTYVTALVVRSANASTVVEVPEWEIDVLNEMHGSESVITQGTRDVLYPHNAAEAMQYLRNKYTTREQEDVIKRLYPRLRDFAKSTGLPYRAGDEATNQVPASSVIYHTPEARTSSATKQRGAGSATSGKTAA